VLNGVSLAIVLGVWILQMCHVRAGVFTSSGADLSGAMLMYTSLRQETRWPRLLRVFSPARAASFVFLGCLGFEFAQGMHLVPGGFDPFDVLNYGGGVLVCYLCDRWITPVSRREVRTIPASQGS
jgi:hypothetical protein